MFNLQSGIYRGTFVMNDGGKTNTDKMMDAERAKVQLLGVYFLINC